MIAMYVVCSVVRVWCWVYVVGVFFCVKQKTAYEMRISDWSSDVCSSDLPKSTAHDSQNHVCFAGHAKNAVDPAGSQQAVDPVCGMTVDPATTQHHAEHDRSEEHTSELQSLMRISYAVFCLKKKITSTKLTDDKLKHVTIKH